MARLPNEIGKYEIVERIGKGGMGMVYKARHPTLDRFVILKKLNVSGDAAMRERFRREAVIMIDFRTDYVVDVYDHFRHAGSDYIAMEFVDGESLDQILERERYLPSDVALAIARDCFRGLDYVHGKGVVHRDVKPGNIIIGRDGSVKLLDFGIASRAVPFDEELTRDGMTLGTVAYIAPEQIEHSRSADHRADIYSAGAMLYEMVTGRKPFTGGFTPETVNRIQRGRYRRPRRANPQVSRFASRIITRCMRRKAGRRFASAGEAAALIEDHLESRDAELRGRIGALVGGETPAPVRNRWLRRRLFRIAVAAVLIILVAIGAAYATGYLQRFLLRESHALVRYELRIRKDDEAAGPPSGNGVDGKGRVSATALRNSNLVKPDGGIALSLERDDEGAFTNVTPRLPLLHIVPSLETPDYQVLRSRLLTLPAGRYRSTIRINGTTYVDITTISPLGSGNEVVPLSATWDAPGAVDVDLSVAAYDSESGAALPARVEIKVSGRWRALVGGSRTVGEGVEAVAAADRETLVRVGELLARIEGNSRQSDLLEDDRGAGEAETLMRSSSPAESPSEAISIDAREPIEVRLTHPGYVPVTTVLKPDLMSRAIQARIGMTRTGREEEQ